MIYFIYDELSNAVKIGKTQDDEVYTRLSVLQTGNPRELVLLGVVKGYTEEERELHYRFNEYRIRGEWFEYVKEIRTYLEVNRLDYSPVKKKYKYDAIKSRKREKEKVDKIKTHLSNLINTYFELDENNTLLTDDLREFCLKNNILNIGKTNPLQASKIAQHFGLTVVSVRLGNQVTSGIKGLRIKP